MLTMQQHHAGGATSSKQTAPTGSVVSGGHLANTHLISSQSERTATTDIEAKSAALINTQRNNFSNGASSINTAGTKVGAPNALCSTERFSEEVRYKQSKNSMQVLNSDTAS